MSDAVDKHGVFVQFVLRELDMLLPKLDARDPWRERLTAFCEDLRSKTEFTARDAADCLRVMSAFADDNTPMPKGDTCPTEN